VSWLCNKEVDDVNGPSIRLDRSSGCACNQFSFIRAYGLLISGFMSSVIV
jgi:hypothetical protein